MKYTVTLQLDDKDAFNHFVESIGPIVERLVISVDAGAPTAAEQVHALHPEPKARAPRGSKVNDTILGALQHGPQTVKALKEALEGADLSAGSLSTGIATLQRSGALVRAGEGLYSLPEAA